MQLVFQLLVNGLVSGASIALLALGFVLVLNATGVFHIAHAAAFVFAAYSLYALSTSLGLPLWLAVPGTVLLTAALGVAMEAMVYRPLRARRVPTVALFIASLGMFIVIQNLLLVSFGGQFRSLGTSAGETSWNLAGISLTPLSAAQMVAAPVFYGGLYWLLRRTTLGKWIRAVSINSTRAATVGVNLHLTYAAVFAIASALAVPPALVAALELGIHPALGFNGLLLAITAAIVGGMRNLNGALVGGLVIGLAQSLAILWLSATWQQSIVFALLVLFLLFRPQGLLPERA